MASFVLPGAVKCVLSTAEWRDYHICVYQNAFDEIVIMNDLELLQVIRPTPKEAPTLLTAAINDTTGNIVICCSGALVVWGAIALFEAAPRWVKLYDAVSLGALDAGWLDDSRLSVVTSGSVLVWHVHARESEWNTVLPMVDERRVSCSQISGIFITYDLASEPIVWIRGNSWGDTTFSILRSCETTKLVKFLTPETAAVFGESLVLVWHLPKARLMLSIPCPKSTPLLLGDSNGDVVFVKTSPSASTREVDLHDAESVSIRNSSFDLLIPPGEIVGASRSRIYSLVDDHSVCQIYDVETKSQIGNLSGVRNDGGACIATSSDRLYASGTLFGLDNQAIKVISHLSASNDITSACFLGSDRLLLLLTSQNVLRLKAGDLERWSHTLGHPPLALSVTDNRIILVCKEYVAVHKVSNGELVRRTHFDGTIELAAAFESTLLLVCDSKIEMWTVDRASQARKLDEAGLLSEGEEAQEGQLSLHKKLGVLPIRHKDQYLLKIWGISKSVLSSPMTVAVSGEVSGLAWSVDGSFLSVLEENKVQIYAVVRACRGFLAEIKQITLSEFGPPQAATWDERLNLLIFNGRQIAAYPAELDDFGFNVAKTTGLQLGEKSFTSLARILGEALPIYHPKCLLLLSMALETTVIRSILLRLVSETRFADVTSEGILLIDSSLGFNSLEELLEPGDTQMDVTDISSIASGRHIRHIQGVSDEDMKTLRGIASVISKYSDTLDPFAIGSLLAESVECAKTRSVIYAWFSGSKPTLMSILEESRQSDVEPTLDIWLDREALAQNMEQVAKRRFAQERDPVNVTLFYLALRKKSVIQALWRISSGAEREKTLKLLSNDFTQERWRLAAQKNAYALLSKHRPEYAAAFFLLGGAITDCCQVIASKLNDLNLAIAVARVYDGDSGDGMRFLLSRFFKHDPWLTVWGSWLVNGAQPARSELLQSVKAEPSTLMLYLALHGELAEHDELAWKNIYKEYGFADLLVDALFTRLRNEKQAASDTGSTNPAANQVEADLYKSRDNEMENRSMPVNLKPAPQNIQLEPDMSAFGF